MQDRYLTVIALIVLLTANFGETARAQPAANDKRFEIIETTIADIHEAIRQLCRTLTRP